MNETLNSASADAVDNEDISEKCELCDLMNLDDFGLWRPKQALAVYRCYGELEINIPDSAAHLPDVTDLEAWRLLYREYITTVIIIRDYIRFADLVWDLEAAHPDADGHTCSAPTTEALDFDQSINAVQAQDHLDAFDDAVNQLLLAIVIEWESIGKPLERVLWLEKQRLLDHQTKYPELIWPEDPV